LNIFKIKVESAYHYNHLPFKAKAAAQSVRYGPPTAFVIGSIRTTGIKKVLSQAVSAGQKLSTSSVVILFFLQQNYSQRALLTILLVLSQILT